jgi:predicted nucleotidyltransferase
MPIERAHAPGRTIPRPDDPVVLEVIGRLVAAYRPERIYLFGSAARGDAGPDSDYDILVVVPDAAAPELHDERPAYEALVGAKVAVDVLVYAASDFYGRLPLKASLPSPVAREGRLLYAA